MLTGAAILLVLLIALLAVPVTLTYRISWRQDFHSDIRMLWLFGLVRIQFPSLASIVHSSINEQLVQKNHPHEPSIKKMPSLLAIIRQDIFRQRVIRFAKDSWRAIHKNSLSLRLRIGLDNPADTGRLWAIVGPIAGMLSNYQKALIEIEPEFLDTIFEFDTSGNVRFIPLQMIFLIAGLLLSPQIWKGISQIRATG